ncbi:MAG: c-type cytochrome [Rhodopila sp.]|jgi:mono/diheme cytochrome c family protein
MRTRAGLFPLALILLLGSCDDMIHQRKVNPWARKGGDPAPVPAQTVQFREKPEPPPPVTLALLERGQQRFRIYCTPCHSELGNGHGMIVQRGFSPPPDYNLPRVKDAPTAHYYDVMTNGFGAMYSFAQRVPPRDRWAIASYIRALQLSQHMAVADLTPEQRNALK